MRKFKKLNRKGFTLIELLAVIVILAVIMVIASTSVLSSMNESKKKSLLNSAQSAADSFTTNFSEQILMNNNIILGVSGLMEGTSTTPAGTVGNMSSETTYKALGINATDYDLANSFVTYNGSRVLVCFVAKGTGSFYVAAAKSSADVTKDGLKLASGTMWACSDGTHSWTN